MTLTLDYRKLKLKNLRIRGVALPAAAMSGALLYSSILGSLVSYSANQDLTVHAFELSKADMQEATYALPVEAEADAVTILDGRFPSAYLNEDADLLSSGKILSASIGTAAKRSRVYLLEKGSEYTLVLQENGSTGFVNNHALTSDPATIFDQADMTRWIAEEEVSILSAPSESSETLVTAYFNDEIQVIGTNDLTYWKVRYDDMTGYIDHELLMDEMYVEPEPEPEPEPVAEETSETSVTAEPMANPAWDGSVLTPWAGVVYGPSGKETYYNLNMSGVIALMQAAGYYAEYWVREDGVKMYGDYVMAACGFSVRPRGTIVETSLGTAICADTGTFAYEDPYQIDIAVDW